MRASRPGTRPRTLPQWTRGPLVLLAAAAAALTATVTVPAGPAHAAPAAGNATTARTAATQRAGSLSQEQALARARSTGRPVPVTAATTDSSTLTANPNGTLTLSETNLPVRRNVAGRWLPLDATLHRDSDGSVSPAVTAQPVRLSGGGTGPAVTMTSAGHTLSMTLPGRLPVPSLSGPTATYHDVLPGVDLELTADTLGGVDEVLVVQNATAARNPALRNFTFSTSVSGGLSMRASAQGDLMAVTRGGHVYFDEPAPVMWDSRPLAHSVPTAVDPAMGRRIDLRDGQPIDSSVAGPGENARSGRIGVRFSRGQLTYSPDMSLLSGAHTVYPVYIDPWIPAGSTRQYWAQADSTWPTQTYPKPSLMQVGYQGWQSPTFIARSFVRESVPSDLYGTSTVINSATLYLTDEYAPTCDTSLGDFGVQVWRTNGISSSTDWSNQPAWNVQQGSTKSFAYGYSSSCPAASAGFDVKEAMTTAAQGSWGVVTFGIKADSESDEYGWKQFSSTVTLTTNFDVPPTVGSLATSPSTTCTASTPDTVGNGNVMLYATVSSPEGAKAGTLTATFYATDTSSGAAVKGSPFTITGLGDGATASAELPQGSSSTSGSLDALAGSSVTEFSWYVTVTDGTLTAQSHTCHFKFDPTSPGAPTVTPTATSYTIGTAAAFDVTPNASGTVPSSYTYQLNGAAPHAVTASSSGDATITVTPTSGTDALTVTAISAGGNVGQSATVYFTASAPANAADSDMTGDGIPDLITPGGSGTGLPAGLWQAAGQAGAGLTSGDGQVVTASQDIGTEGDGLAGDYSPSDFTGSQDITGLFSDNGLQDVLTYFPPGTGSYAGQGAILDGSGDGSVLENQNSANTIAVKSANFIDNDPYGDIPLQVANSYNADPNDSPSYPDLMTVSGDSTNGYYLEYYQNGGVPGFWVAAVQLSNPTPDGTMDWNQWQVATMAEPSGAVDMFLYDASTGALYLWQNVTVDDFNDVANFTSYELSANWAPGTLSELRAADITGTGPALWAVTTSGAVTSWVVSGLSGTPAITEAASQSLLSPVHSWRLGDGTSGTASSAADTGSGAALPLTGNSGTTWDTNETFNPSVQFNGTSGYMATSAQAVNTTSSYTISAWVKPTALGGIILSQYGTAASCIRLSIFTTTTNSVTTGYWRFATTTADSSTATSDEASVGTTYPVELGTWTHLTASYDASAGYVRLYVNGIPAASVSVSGTWSSGCNTFTLGRWMATGGSLGGYFKGEIADVQTYNTYFSPTQAATLSGTPGYILFPSDSHQYGSAASSTTWQWSTAGAKMNFYQGLLTIKQTGTKTGTSTFGTSGYSSAVLTLQKDGNLVIYQTPADATAANTGAIWAAGTYGNSGDVMLLQPDGNLVIYNDYGKNLWASNTAN